MSKNPILAALSIPFLPGGGRGVILFVSLLLVIVGFALWKHTEMMHVAGGSNLLDEGMAGVIAAALYALVYVGLPSSVLAPFSDRPILRAASRAVVPFVIATFAFVPAVGPVASTPAASAATSAASSSFSFSTARTPPPRFFSFSAAALRSC